MKKINLLYAIFGFLVGYGILIEPVTTCKVLIASVILSFAGWMLQYGIETEWKRLETEQRYIEESWTPWVLNKPSTKDRQ